MKMRHNTKRGPGRVPYRKTDKPGSRKYPIAYRGGNWQGLEYISLVEHDMATTMVLSMQWPYQTAIERVIAMRGTV